MSSEIDEYSQDRVAIDVDSVSKVYHVYRDAKDRLRQFVIPALRRILGLPETRYYKNFSAVRNVSFRVERGHVVGILGRNGSGKSTLLQLICGTLTPSAGSIDVNGRIAALLELGSGFNPEFSGRENVYLNAAILGLDKEETERRLPSIEEFADIGDFIDQPVKTYSSGMAVRLAFSVAINVDPDILVVDEALAVGDELFQRKCFARIQQIRENGGTILFVSHSGGTIIDLCDHAVLMDGGELIAQGKPKEIVGQYQRLLYAPADRREHVRNGIIHGAIIPAAAHEEAPKSKASLAEKEEELLIPDLVPASTMSYESNGAHIENAHIRTPDGERVNGLIRGRTYVFSYEVLFERRATLVRFGMQIKTKTGFPLGSAMSGAHAQDGIAVIEKGRRAIVDFEFEVPLNQGTYFLNAGVFSSEDGEDVLMHRISDVAAFAVLPVENNRIHEVVDFGCRPRVTVNE